MKVLNNFKKGASRGSPLTFFEKKGASRGSPLTFFFKKGEGFTLIEILVVLGVFTMLVLLMINVFLLTLKAQRQASARQNTVSNLRFVMETMAQDIRTTEINYDLALLPQVLNLRTGQQTFSYFLSGGEIQLSINGDPVGSALTNVDEVQIFKMNFFVDPPNDPFAEERCNIDAHCLGSNSCTINDPATKDFRAGFCICAVVGDNTSECPVVGNCVLDDTLPEAEGTRNLCLPFDRQPRVTISLGFQPVGLTGPRSEPIFLQTTVSSRIYKR